MKKHMLLAALVLTSAMAQAGTVYRDRELIRGGMITPDVAVDYTVYSSERLDKDLNGFTVVCPREFKHDYNVRTCLNSQGQTKWRRLNLAIPQGRTFVGFDVRHDSVIVYWK